MKSIVSTGVAALALAVAGTATATDWIWNTESLAGFYLDPSSWIVSQQIPKTFEPSSTDTLRFAGGHDFAPRFPGDAGLLAVTGRWHVASGNALHVSVPSGTELLLGETFEGSSVIGALSLSGKVRLQQVRDSYGFACFYSGSTVDVFGEGTVVRGMPSEKTPTPTFNGSAGPQHNLRFVVRDGACVSNVSYFVGNGGYSDGSTFAFSGPGTTVRAFSTKGNLGMRDGRVFITNGVTVADSPNLAFYGTNVMALVEDAVLTNSGLSVSGVTTVRRSRLHGPSVLDLGSGTGFRKTVADGTSAHVTQAVTLSARGDAELLITGAGTRAEVRTTSGNTGMMRIGTQDTRTTPCRAYQTRLAVTDGAYLGVGVADGVNLSERSHVGICIGQGTGVPADNCELLVANGAVVSNRSSTLVGGGYQARPGANNRLIVSNATFCSHYYLQLGDTSILEGHPSTNNLLAVLDGGQATVGCLQFTGIAGKTGGHACRVRNATLRSESDLTVGSGASFGPATLAIGGTNGYVNTYAAYVNDGGRLHLAFDVPREGKTDGRPYLDVRYAATTSISASGIDAEVKVAYGWAMSGRRNFIDLIRTSRGGSAEDHDEMPKRLQAIMDSIPVAPLNGCSLSIVTNLADTTFSGSGTYSLRLTAGPRKGLTVLVR